MERSKNLMKLAAALALLVSGSAAHAVAITLDGGTPATGGGTNYAFGAFGAGNALVDPEGGDLAITKSFIDLSSVSFSGTFDGFVGDTTVAVSEAITNNSVSGSMLATGGDWFDYHIEIEYRFSTACIALNQSAGASCSDSVGLTDLMFTGFADWAMTMDGDDTGGSITVEFSTERSLKPAELSISTLPSTSTPTLAISHSLLRSSRRSTVAI